MSPAVEAYRAGLALGIIGGASLATTVAIMVDLHRRDIVDPAVQRAARRRATVRVLLVPRPYDWANRGDR